MNDGFGVVGIGLIAYGVSIRFGTDVACIIVGVICLALAVIGAIRK